MTDLEQLTEAVAVHGEGPVWHAPWDGLRWVDMMAGDVLQLGPGSGEVSRIHVGTVAAAIRPRINGGMVVGLERGFALWDPGADAPRPLPELWSGPSVRMNEGGCDPQGRFYCGSMAYNFETERERGALYRLDLNGDVEVVLERITISNGLAWAPDGETVYHIDSGALRVDAFDFDSDRGTLLNRRPFVEIRQWPATPDGMTVDSEGYLWVALWDGAAIHRYSPDGRLDDVIEMPVRRVTACTFGGAKLDELYITTSRYGIETSAEPEAGAVFRARPGVRGLATIPFAG